MALEMATQIARDGKQKLALRIRTAETIGNWRYIEGKPGRLQKQMASILVQFLLDRRTNTRWRNKCINALQRWQQTEPALEALEKAVKDEQLPISHRLWAVESFAKMANEEQASYFLTNIIENPTINPRVRRIAQKIKQRVSKDVPVNLTGLQKMLAIILLVQAIIFTTLSWFFPYLVIPFMHKLYGTYLNANTLDYNWTSRLEIDITLSLYICLSLYVLSIYYCIYSTLWPIKKHQALNYIILGLLLFYPFNICIILIFNHIISGIDLIKNIISIWNINRTAILPTLLFIYLISLRAIRSYFEKSLKFFIFLTKDILRRIIGATNVKVIVISVTVQLCLFAVLFMALIFPLWITSTIITTGIIILQRLLKGMSQVIQ